MQLKTATHNPSLVKLFVFPSTQSEVQLQLNDSFLKEACGLICSLYLKNHLE